MTIERLDHVNISTADLAATKAFFVDILGLTEGARPNFSFPGAWLYSGDTAVVHLVEVPAPTSGEVGALDHFAFHAGDFAGLTARLRAHGHAFESRVVPGSGRQQVFVRDPNGVRVELNFPPA